MSTYPQTSPLTRPGPSAVTYHLPTSPPSSANALKTTIHLPQSSTWSSGLHFHTTHTEYLRLTQGAIFLRLGHTTQILCVKKGEQAAVVTVPKHARHDWGRAEEWIRKAGQEGKGHDRIEGENDVTERDLEEEVVVEEWTDPVDVDKALFFWNLNGVLMDLGTRKEPRPESALGRFVRWVLGGWWVEFQLFVIFWELDNYPVLFEVAQILGWKRGGIGEWMELALEYVVTYTVLYVASIIGKLIRVKAVSEERTPKALWEDWNVRQRVEKRKHV